MRIIKGDNVVAFVFDNANDIDAMLIEFERMKAQLKAGVVSLPLSFLGVDENATDAEREEFVRMLLKEGGGG